MQPTPQSWSPEDDEIVRREHARGAPDSYIAQRLFRSRASIKARRRLLGLTFFTGSANTPARRDPTPEEIRERCERLRACWDENERRKRAGMSRDVEWTAPEVEVMT